MSFHCLITALLFGAMVGCKAKVSDDDASSDTETASVASDPAPDVSASPESSSSAPSDKVEQDAKTLTLLALSAAPASLPIGEKSTFTLTATYSDSTTANVTATATWASSDQSVATVAAGVVTAAEVGTATISATLDGKSAAAGITATPAELVSTAIAPQPAQVAYGATTQLQLLAKYTDGTTVDLTSKARWSSSSMAVSVENGATTAGLVKGRFQGVSVVTAVYRGATYTASVDVNRSGSVCTGALLTNTLGDNGSDTSTDPLVVCTFAQLQEITSGTHYIKLGQDIDASASAFTPISNFHGTFDGDGRVISGLHASSSTASSLALFVDIAAGADTTIENLNLKDIDYTVTTAVPRVGGLVANPSNTLHVINATVTGTITCPNCSVLGGLISNVLSGEVTNAAAAVSLGAGSSSYQIGGLIANAGGTTITNSWADGAVSGTDYAGGLVGYMTGTHITGCHASGDVTGSPVAGGLVGRANGVSPISRSYATGNVSAAGYGGGLAGQTSAAVSDSYATGDVSSTGTAGGLVAYNPLAAATLARTYASGNVTAANAGGLIGYQRSTSTSAITHSFATGQTSGTNHGGIGAILQPGSGVVDVAYYLPSGASTLCFPSSTPSGCTSRSELASFSDGAQAPLDAWDFTTTWRIPDDGELPVLND